MINSITIYIYIYIYDALYRNKFTSPLNEQTKIEASQEHAITDMQNMTNKIDTFYKPKIRELESEINELKKLLPEDTKIEKK